MLFDFGQRRIQKIGYSYMFPLPTNWVRDMKIDNGDQLHIKMTEDKSLWIEPGQDDNSCLVNPWKTGDKQYKTKGEQEDPRPVTTVSGKGTKSF